VTEPTIRAQDIKITITGNASVQENETVNYEIKVANTNPRAEDEFRIEIRLNGLTKDIHITAKPSAPGYPGFTYLRTQTYSCGGVTNTVKEYRHDRTGMEFVLIPGGTFTMGSPGGEAGRYDNEGPQHQVTLSPYLISKTEVTQAVWERVMGSNPSSFKGPDRPVEKVSWKDCVSFCEKTGLALPTEAQWEFAARSGTQSAYYFGNNSSSLENYAWYDGNSSSQTHPVAQKQANAYGLYDMAGNVYEWCYDWYSESYSSSSVTNPTGPTSGASRVFRGGSWGVAARRLRSAFRGWIDPGLAYDGLGFRVLAGRP